MQKVFDEVYSLDQRCYDKFGLNEDILMENAAQALSRQIHKRFDKNSTVFIVSGPGNNGADGITLARILQGDFKVFLYLPFGAKSKMSNIQLERAKKVGITTVDEIKEANVVVDALFGSGLNKPLDDKTVQIIEELNRLKAYKIACDIPTGIDTKGNPNPIAFKADLTISMGAYKTPLFSDNAKDFIGKVKVADLGVSKEIYEGETKTYLLDKKDMKLPYRINKSSNKGDFGHSLMILGEKKGACMIAAKASFAFGSGLCSVYSKKPVKLPDEIMLTKEIPQKTTSIAIGMGLGKKFTGELVNDIIEKKDTPLVLDADILKNEAILSFLNNRSNIVLTPHPKEFSLLLRICGFGDISSKEVQQNRFALVREFTDKYKDAVLLLKGSNTLVAQNGKVFINTFGTSTLSKGGSGDVLTGMTAALLAQGYSILDAAITATLAHSFAAKRYKKANYSLSPNDLIEGIKCL
jgi:hydroxyethylthiazole kinase-like uncharacterized protein yjeF